MQVQRRFYKSLIVPTKSLSRGDAALKCMHSLPSAEMLLHNHNCTQCLHGLNNLLRLLLRHALLHQLWRTLHKLLAVHQTQAQQALDLLDHLGLRARVERLKLQVEQCLLLFRRRGIFLLGRGFELTSPWYCSAWRCYKAAHRHVGDVES